MEVRDAGPDELPTVMTIFDAGLLETSADAVEAAIEAGRVLVATVDGAVLGVIWVDATTADSALIEAVAVRPGRRGQGVGTALVEAAAERYGGLTAEFEADVRPFWESLDFTVQSATEPGRYVGHRPAVED